MTPDPTPTPPENPPTPEPTDDAAALRQEAATRRRQLRETEAERDGLRERLDRRDRAVVNGLAAERLQDPADWTPDLDALRNDEGDVDAELVSSALDDLLQSKPHWGKVPPRQPAPDFHQGPQPPEPQNDKPSFAEALRGAGSRRRGR